MTPRPAKKPLTRSVAAAAKPRGREYTLWDGALAHFGVRVQPTLTRDIARLEHRFGGKLFERLPHGVRLTALSAAAAERARRVLRELHEERPDAAPA